MSLDSSARSGQFVGAGNRQPPPRPGQLSGAGTGQAVPRSGRVVGAGRRRTGPVASAVLVLGAALLLSSSIIHLHLWVDGFRRTSTIGQLFFAQGAVGIALSILVALIRRIFIALLGALFATGTIIALLLASHGGIFGYRTTLSAPFAKTALAVEAAAIVLLVGGGCLAVAAERAHVRRWRSLKLPES